MKSKQHFIHQVLIINLSYNIYSITLKKWFKTVWDNKLYTANIINLWIKGSSGEVTNETTNTWTGQNLVELRIQ